MPTIPHDRLERFAAQALRPAGAPGDIATAVAAHLVEANLKGVDSHGVIRLAPYLAEIAEGGIMADARSAVTREAPAYALVDGGGGFGIPALDHAAAIAADKAAQGGVAAVGVVRCGHTGRIGHYAERIAARNQFGLVLGGGGHRRWPMVAPHGGARRVLGTNPYAFALPGGRRGPVVVDFATSATAQGKLAIKRETCEALPDGWILDREGRPSTVAEDFYRGGMLLPAAGPKGYGMALIAELAGAAIAGRPSRVQLAGHRARPRRAQPGRRLRGRGRGRGHSGAGEGSAAGRGLRRVHDSRRARGAASRAAPRGRHPLPDAVWAKIGAAARAVGVDAGEDP